ncbi:unnamed protein product, partial [Rotaria sp. Silwood1]
MPKMEEVVDQAYERAEIRHVGIELFLLLVSSSQMVL